MRVGTGIYPSFLESALHTLMSYIGLNLRRSLAIAYEIKAHKMWWRILALNLFQCAFCYYVGSVYVFYLRTTESSMAERNIFPARSRFGFQGKILQKKCEVMCIYMKRSRPLKHHQDEKL